MTSPLDPSTPPADPRAFLRAVPMLAELDEPTLTALLLRLEWVRMRSATPSWRGRFV